ncbi:MAG: hypothetical protein RLZZ517_400 [Candidatus Parcubacteria bacterium]|jgi:hypothetical protein
MKRSSTILCLLAAVASIFLSSCILPGGYTRYGRDSKGGNVPIERVEPSRIVSPFGSLINVEIVAGADVGVTPFSYRSGYCPPPACGGRQIPMPRPCPPGYGGRYQGGYNRPSCPSPGYNRPPMPRPCPPGYNNGYRRPYYGAAGNGIITGSQAGGMYEFSDQYLGGRRIR